MWRCVCAPASVWLQKWGPYVRTNLTPTGLLLNTMFLIRQRQTMCVRACENVCVQEHMNVCMCVRDFKDHRMCVYVFVCVCACVGVYVCVWVCVCVAARLREINTRYDRKMKALLWVTTERRGRVGTHTHTHTDRHAHTYTITHTYILPSCLLVMWVRWIEEGGIPLEL